MIHSFAVYVMSWQYLSNQSKVITAAEKRNERLLAQKRRAESDVETVRYAKSAKLEAGDTDTQMFDGPETQEVVGNTPQSSHTEHRPADDEYDLEPPMGALLQHYASPDPVEAIKLKHSQLRRRRAARSPPFSDDDSGNEGSDESDSAPKKRSPVMTKKCIV